RAQLLHEAEALWRGPPLADFTYEPFAQRAIAELEELRLTALEDRIDADLALGRAGLVAEIDAVVKEHPFRERVRALQMLALYREGRQAEALSAYRAARATLAEEMGIDLGPGLRDLHEKILRQDSSLERPTTPAGMGTWLPGERQVALSLALAEVHLVLGQFGQAQAMLRNIIDVGDAFAAHAARLENARIQFIIGPDPVPLSQIEDEAHAAAEYFKADDAARTRAAFLLGCVRMREGRMTDAEVAFRDSMARADRAGHMRARLDIALKGEERENIAQAAGWLALLHRRMGGDAADSAALSAERAPFGVPGKAVSLAANGDAHAAVDLVPKETPNLRADMLLESATELRTRGDEAGAKEGEDEAARL